MEAQITLALLHKRRPLGVVEPLPVHGRFVEPAEQGADRVWIDELVEEVSIENLLGEPVHLLVK